MLKDLLRALAKERPYTVAELAAELHSDASEVRLAFDHCERMGYLERVAVACGDCCEACSVHDGDRCGSAVGDKAAIGPSWWRVTESGRRAARISGGSPPGGCG